MDINRKIVSRLFQRFIHELDIKQLKAIKEAEQAHTHACYNLGMSSQIARADEAEKITRNIVDSLSKYQIESLESALKFAYREADKNQWQRLQD
jgi:hypothetical protein